MKLKSLLLGSAAAMIAVSGARAADAVVAEPEAVEYVRVCDLYGAGFFYIPGTETCLAFSGYVRLDYTYNDNDNAVSSDNWDYRVRFNIDARNETDYGTLRSQIRFQADGNGGFNTLGFAQGQGPNIAGSVSQGDAFVGVDRALISLGGLRMGYSDSYTTTLHGYGSTAEKYDGYYGYDQAIFLDYTYAANGFTATAGIQDSTGPTVAAQPHVNFEYYVGGSYTGGFGTLAASYIYEQAVEEGAWKVSANITAIEGWRFKAWYTGDSDGTTNQVQGTGEYNWGIGADYAVSDTINVTASYTDGDNLEAYGTVGMRWSPVPGLSVRPEVQIREDTGQSYSLRVYRNF